MPSARKAEEQRPFIDLRSPTEGSEVSETKKENVSPNTTPPPEGGSAASRDPKYVSGWRINERFAQRQDKQTQTRGTPKEEVTPPQSVPDDAATEATASRAEQTRGDERPQQAHTCPPDTKSSAPPVLTQANAAQAQEGSLDIEGEIPPAQEGEAVPPTSREEGGPLTPPDKEPPLPPGVEKATRGGYARAQLKIVEVSCFPSPTRWENTPYFVVGDHH